MDYRKEYERWLSNATDEDIKNELEGMDEKAMEDAFYRDLAFGTGGLRGTIGAGTNRMNIYVVAKASQGLSQYLLERYHSERPVKGAIHRGWESLPVRPSEPPCSRLGLCSSAQLEATRM